MNPDSSGMELEQFTANLAHEIRNPLMNVLLTVSLLDRRLSDEESRALLDRIREGIRKVDTLISGLLSWSTDQAPRMKPTDLRAVVRSALSGVEFWIQESAIELKLDLDPVAMIEADPQQIEQVVLNLLLNAVQAMEGRPERRIEVRTRMRSGRPVLEILDTGTGVAPHIRARLFEPLVTTKASGTGLGLTIVKRILDRHRAEIRFSSSENVGTRVSVQFNSFGQGECAWNRLES